MYKKLMAKANCFLFFIKNLDLLISFSKMGQKTFLPQLSGHENNSFFDWQINNLCSFIAAAAAEEEEEKLTNILLYPVQKKKIIYNTSHI